MAESCTDCRFFFARASATTLVGQCRYSPPSAQALQVEDGRRTIKLHAYWPLVDGTDWCGAFEQASEPDHDAVVLTLSTPNDQLGLVDMPEGRLRLCRSCNAQILFAPTKPTKEKPEGSKMPLTWPHNPRGNVVWDPDSHQPVSVYRNGDYVPGVTPEEHRWHSHFIDCPGATTHRKRR